MGSLYGQRSLEPLISHIAHGERQLGVVAPTEETRQVVGHHQRHPSLHRSVDGGHVTLAVVDETLQPPSRDIVGHGKGKRSIAVAIGRRSGSPEGKRVEVAAYVYIGITISPFALVVRREILSLVGSGIESVFFLYLNVSFDDGCRELIHRLRNAQCDNLLKIVFVVVQ